MEDLQDYIVNAGLVMLPVKGMLFTWFNQSVPPRSLWKRLDRMLVNEAWLSQWLESYYICAATRTSDHSPIIIQGGEWLKGPTMFRFDNFLARDPGFLSVVNDIWRHPIYGSTMYGIVKKLKLLKPKF
ncbi:UNVERIFIED_CONTAM: hypothetical protein Slati_0983600 [Sesamum latifolium]|uniref:Uncharacterized protein n=1 Tax=Sesamum latifolium TaxID=2727402 RepID=A0AAW2XR90_9LAMI